MSYRADKLVIDTHTHTHTRTHRPTDAGDDNTRRPKLASGKNDLYIKTWSYLPDVDNSCLYICTMHEVVRIACQSYKRFPPDHSNSDWLRTHFDLHRFQLCIVRSEYRCSCQWGRWNLGNQGRTPPDIPHRGECHMWSLQRKTVKYVDGLMQDHINSCALAMELLLPCTLRF